MSVKRVGRIEYIEPNNMNYRNVYNDALKYDAFAKGKHFVGNNDGGAVDAKIQSDRFMPYDLEDLCLYVDFYVLTNNRGNCGSPENDGDSVIAQYSGKGVASYLYGTDSDLPEQGAVGENSLTNKHFMTTNFTEISLVNPVGNTNECVGISSINIEYGNLFTPIVRVTFVDVMGASIFLKEEKGMYDTKKNTYDIKASSANKMAGSNLLASLFMYPYPTFVLTLKGFFGDAVSYHLVCSGTDIKFNESVGNFEIRADFAGSLYGALADIPMTFLGIAPYIERFGRAYWENETRDSSTGRFFFKGYDGKKTQVPMKTFAELLFQNDSLSDNIKKNFETNDEVKEYQKLITARKMIGEIDFPMGRVNPGANMLLDTWYCRKAKSTYYYYWVGAEIENLADAAAIDMHNKIHKELHTFTNSVNTFNDSELGFVITDPSMLLSETNNPFQAVSGTNLTILNEFYTISPDSDGFFTSASRKDGKEVNIEQLKEAYPVLSYYLTTYTDENGKERYVRIQEKTKRVFIYEIASSSDYRSELVKTKNKINAAIRERKDKIEALKKDALVELYGYTPSLQNINDVALAHLDVFMTVFYDTLNNIDSKKISGERSLQNLGIKLSQTDLPDGYSYTAPLPPFTLFYAPTVNNDKITEDEKWPPVLNNKLTNLDEVKLVEAIVEASSMYQQNVGDFIRNDKDVIDGVNRFPASIYEALENIKNPYSDIVSKSNDKHFIDYVSAIFSLRLYYYLATCKNPDIETFAFIEAKNFTAVYDKKFSESVLNYVIEQAKTNGVKHYINKLCGRNTSSNDKDKLFDIGLTNKNGGIFTANGAGELMYTWHKETTAYRNEGNKYSVDGVPENEVYTMPIGLFNFENLGRNFSGKKSYNNTRFITLNNTAFGGSTSSQKDAFNNYNSFRLVDTPNVVIGLFKDKKVIVSTTDKNKTKPLDEILLDKITQHKDNNVYLPSSIFFTAKDSTAAKKTFSELCEQGASGSIPGIYDLNKNAINESYSRVNIGNAKKGCNIFLTSVYYNQNKSERGSGTNKVTMSGKDINCSMGYLYLFSLINNRFGMLQSPGNDFNRNGFFAFTELLKEGAFYWRLKFMLSHNGVDPINLDGLNLKNAKPNEIYSQDSFFFPELNEKTASKCNGLTFIPSTNGSNYTRFLPDAYDYENNRLLPFAEYINNFTSTSISRVENLIELFISWATGKNVFKNSKTNFATVTYYQELRVGGKRLNIDGFRKLDKTPISKLDAQLKAVYNLTSGSAISVKGGSYIDNMSIFGPTEKFDKTEILKYQEYVQMQNTTLGLILDVYFVHDASIFGDNKTSNFKIEYFTKSFEKFISILKEFKYDKEDKEAIEHKNKFSSQEIKLSIYLTLKSLYDRWCCSKDAIYWKYDFLKEGNTARRSCISQYFVYMDTYYNKIGHNLIANMDGVVNMIKEFTPTYSNEENKESGLNNGTVLSYMSHIAEKCGCAFYALPQDLTMRKVDALANMFKPIPYNKVDFMDDTSTFAIVYSPKLSEHLDNGDGYKNDGYDIADSLGNINPILPESFVENYRSGGDTVKIPSFGVTFGRGNQSYFTRIDFQSSKSSVAQSEYAMKALVDVASSANGATKNAKSYGQDIYSQYANYSYQVTVTMLGCCQVMPLMYFQLNNIPLYHGAYIIQSVSHSVNHGMMTTTFTGIRTSRYGLPVQPGNLLILDSMDWGLEGEDFSTEDDTTVWDVSRISNTVVPDTASLMTYDSVLTAKEQYKDLLKTAEDMYKAKSPDKNHKPLKKLKEMTVQQKMAMNTYLAAYAYSLSIEKKGPDSGATIIKNSINFLDDNKIFSPHDNSFEQQLASIGYNIVINVGSSISGYTSDGLITEIEMRLRQLRPAFGDIVVYYANGVISDRVDDETKKYSLIDKNRITGSDFKTVNDGFAAFYYGDNNNSDERRVFSEVEKSVDKIFYYTEPEFDPKNPNHSTLAREKRKNSGIQPDCYVWDVVIYRRSSSPIGSSVKDKTAENK